MGVCEFVSFAFLCNFTFLPNDNSKFQRRCVWHLQIWEHRYGHYVCLCQSESWTTDAVGRAVNESRNYRKTTKLVGSEVSVGRAYRNREITLPSATYSGILIDCIECTQSKFQSRFKALKMWIPFVALTPICTFYELYCDSFRLAAK